MGQTTSVHVSLTQVVSSSPAQAAAFYYNLQNHMRFNQLAHSIEVLESSGPATGPASAQPATATTSGSEAPVGCWQRYLFIERVPVLCGLSYMENVLTGKIRWQEPAGGAEAQHLLLQVTARNGATGVVVEVTGSAEFEAAPVASAGEGKDENGCCVVHLRLAFTCPWLFAGFVRQQATAVHTAFLSDMARDLRAPHNMKV